MSSQWGRLSPHLIAVFYEADREGNAVGGVEVEAPLTECSLDVALDWRSPFESAGAESKAPMLAAMAQSGAIEPLFTDIKNLAFPGSAEDAQAKQQQSNSLLKKAEGRTGITKLNSTQVFSGMQPAKIQCAALFRAWSDAAAEVEAPVDQLMMWALPIALSEDGAIGSGLTAAGNGGDAVDILLPSQAPTMIGMIYKGRNYSPFVLEASTLPLGSPVTSDGQFSELLVTMTLCSLKAWDRDDWTRLRNR